MKLTNLLQPWIKDCVPESEILGLQNDSREIKPGYLFIAYPGAAVDGRLFMQQAAVAGASAIVYEAEQFPKNGVLPNGIPCIAVPQLAKQLGAIASRFYDYPTHALSVTGVTGTNGKTTIAYQLAQAYELLGKKAAYIGTLGQGQVKALQPLHNTTPDALCLQRLLHDYQQQGVDQLCMEVSSHALAQGRVENIDFTGAIYTNLTLDHLDYHHTMDAYAAAKASLFAWPTLEWAVINQDDSFKERMEKVLPSSCKKITYGIQKDSHVCAVRWNSSMVGSELDVLSPWGEHHIQVNLLGRFNIYNSLAVFASLLAQGFEVNEVITVMAKLRASPGRMEVVSQKPYVIVDFAHTPDALENVLMTLKQLKKGRLGVVFGCGGDRDKTKRATMGQIASQYADFVVVTSDNPRTEEPAQIIEEIAQGLLPGVQAVKITYREEAIKHALNMAAANDIVLIAGKGHESYQEIGTTRIAFSDQEVVRKLLNLEIH